MSRLTQPHRRKYDELLTRLSVQLLLKPRNIAVNTDRLEASNGGRIITSGANISVNAKSITLEGVKREHPSGLIAGPPEDAEGGDIPIKTENLTVSNGTIISARAFGRRQGCDVTVTADRVFLSGDGALPTGIFAGGLFMGEERFEMMRRRGNITVTAGNLEVRNGAEINAYLRKLHCATASCIC